MARAEGVAITLSALREEVGEGARLTLVLEVPQADGLGTTVAEFRTDIKREAIFIGR